MSSFEAEIENIYHTHTRLTALFPGLPGWAGTRKVKPIWILLKQETVSSSGISWAICKSASRSRQKTMPVPYHSFFYRPDALPAAQPTASKLIITCSLIHITNFTCSLILYGLSRNGVRSARSLCKLLPTFANAHYSHDNAIGLVGLLLLPMFMSIKRYAQSS